MKCVIAVTALIVAVCAPQAQAQSSTAASPQSQTLADVAKAEEARRRAVKKPSKVYTNDSLRTDISKPVPPSTPPATTDTPDGGNKTPASPAGKPAPDAPKDQAYWSGRMREAQAQLQRSQIFLDSLQSRINALTTDFVNRDDPAQRAKIEGDRQTALAEFERVKKEVDDQAKAIKAIEEEARRAGVPPGWLRPGA